jgi:AraC-like DNA-binding protein
MIEATNDKAIASKCRELATLIARHTEAKGNGNHQTEIELLELMRDSATATICSVYRPALAIIVQGRKKLLLGQKTYYYGAGQYLVVSVDLPARGFIVEASPDKPYLGFLLNLSSTQLYELVTQIKPTKHKKEKSIRGWFVSDVELTLIDCAIRLARLLDTPQDLPFLAPQIIHEIYYRLLTGEQGEAVRQIATSESSMQRVAKAIELIKTNFTSSLRIEELAEEANMSTSSFHRHFKEVTSMSPLQYQKQLRLLEARRLMLADNADATNAAYQVGYESPSQFSREYARMFGAPPMRDIQQLKLA